MKRRIAILTTVFVLCAAILAGATFAYLNARDIKTNNLVFVGHNKTDVAAIEIREPAWDGVNFTGETPATVLPPGVNGGYGNIKANGFNIGDIINKDPTVKLTGDVDVYVGVIVSGKGDFNASDQFVPDANALTMADLDKIYNLGTLGTGWTEVTVPAASNPNGDRYFIYNTALTSTARKTTPLFTTLTIKPQNAANSSVYTAISGMSGKTHELTIRAYSVQAINESVTSGGGTWDAKTALKAEFDGVTNGNPDWKFVS